MLQNMTITGLAALLLYTAGLKVELVLAIPMTIDPPTCLFYLVVVAIETAIALLLLGCQGWSRNVVLAFCAFLFLLFSIVHGFDLWSTEFGCGCFGGAKSDATLMVVGCLSIAFSAGLAAVAVNRYGGSAALLGLLLGLVSFYASLQNATRYSGILNLCEFIGHSVPFNFSDEVQDSRHQLFGSDRKSIIILNTGCQRCAGWLQSVALDVLPQENFGSKHFVVVLDSNGKFESKKPLDFGEWTEVLIETPVQIQVESGYIVGCSKTLDPNGNFFIPTQAIRSEVFR